MPILSSKFSRPKRDGDFSTTNETVAKIGFKGRTEDLKNLHLIKATLITTCNL